jgi:hypothetical protein
MSIQQEVRRPSFHDHYRIRQIKKEEEWIEELYILQIKNFSNTASNKYLRPDFGLPKARQFFSQA